MEISVLDMPFQAAMKVMEEWVTAEHGGKLKLVNPHDCPVQTWVTHHNKRCGKDMISGIDTCPICGGYVCPLCKNHDCEPLSRVTGYMAAVNGWNASKRQELQDRVKTQM